MGRGIVAALALAGALLVAGAAAQDARGRAPDAPPVPDALPEPAPELVATSEFDISPLAGAADEPLRIVQVGNPARYPPIPDLSRAGEHELPGRVSLEVPPPGVRLGDRWLPPDIYRLALATDGFAPRLVARPLAPGDPIPVAVEIGSMTAPAARFTCTLAARTADGERSATIALRWGALVLAAEVAAPAPVRTVSGDLALDAVAATVEGDADVYLGRLTGSDGEPRGARWIRDATEPRLRLERERWRRFFGLRRDYRARAERLAGLSRSALEAGEGERAERIARIAASYDDRAAQLERLLESLDGDGREILGTARAGRGDRPHASLEERDGAVLLVIDAPGGGAEFRVGESEESGRE